MNTKDIVYEIEPVAFSTVRDEGRNGMSRAVKEMASLSSVYDVAFRT